MYLGEVEHTNEALEDLKIARAYENKYNNAISEGKEFTLSFSEYKKLNNRKRCAYTGIRMTKRRKGKKQRETDLTLERIDNKKGYVPGNVVAVCYAANQVKAKWESPNSIVSQKFLKRVLTNRFLTK